MKLYDDHRKPTDLLGIGRKRCFFKTLNIDLSDEWLVLPTASGQAYDALDRICGYPIRLGIICDLDSISPGTRLWIDDLDEAVLIAHGCMNRLYVGMASRISAYHVKIVGVRFDRMKRDFGQFSRNAKRLNRYFLPNLG